MKLILIVLRLKKFIYHSKANFTETKMLNQEKNVFFFHLLGIDTNGSFNFNGENYL